MQIVVTYIHHNCFVLKTPQRSYLFDYPGAAYLPVNGEELVGKAVAGTDLVVFISHSHADHLNDDIASMAATAKRVRYVLSDDVEEMRPEVIPTDKDVLVVEPDETYDLDGVRIETLMSNDLGVAFLVADGDFRFYFGGDLAKWVWQSASLREESYTATFFRHAMKRVCAFEPQVVFSNVDKRLENLAGGVEAYRTTCAKVFIPMHCFGDTEWLGEFRDSVGHADTEVFVYEEPGDSAKFSI